VACTKMIKCYNNWIFIVWRNVNFNLSFSLGHMRSFFDLKFTRIDINVICICLNYFNFSETSKLHFIFLKRIHLDPDSPNPGHRFFFSDKGNTLILRDINYIQPLQQCNILVVRMHIAKKKTKKKIQVINYITPFLLSVEYLMHG
jgi:hypothetical protein